jgi:hypothetical protein
LALVSVFVSACADEEGYVPRVNYGYGSAGGSSGDGNSKGTGSSSNGNSNSNDNSGGGGATNNQTTSGDPQTNNNDPAPPSPAPSTTQADAGSPPDASTTPTTPTTTAPPGSCLNPSCTADGNGLCGCKATDANGNLVFMGCQDGACACFDSNGNDTDDFNATCDDVASAQLAFQQCACTN